MFSFRIFQRSYTDPTTLLMKYPRRVLSYFELGRYLIRQKHGRQGRGVVGHDNDKHKKTRLISVVR